MTFFLIFLVAGAIFCMGIAFYRLFLSPLAAFPGPKLAALTKWTEAYYELLYGEGGQFMFKYRAWHSKYGMSNRTKTTKPIPFHQEAPLPLSFPLIFLLTSSGPIIRISPAELHIQDSSFFHDFFSVRGADKLGSLAHRFNSPTSAFSTTSDALHRIRRGALNPFFSKRRISERCPKIQYAMQRVCQRLENEFSGKNTVLNLSGLWGCWTSDIIAEYCFGESHGFIEHPEFSAEFTQAMISLLEPVHWVTQFPFLAKLIEWIPDAIMLTLIPDMAPIRWFNKVINLLLLMVPIIIEMAMKIAAVKSTATTLTTTESADTIFASIMLFDLPETEKSTVRLQHEAISVVGAGIETTMRALTVASFFLINDDRSRKRLQEELDVACPDPQNMPSWSSLSQLPYLSACITEGLRMAYGTPQRLPRVFDKPITYGDWKIPARVPISMDIYSISHDEKIFPESFEFIPERWLGQPLAPDGRPLSHYLAAFGKGSRSCVGMQLAYAELYIGLASLFRRFEFALWETDRTDVDLARDRFVPRPKASSKGIRVLVNDRRAKVSRTFVSNDGTGRPL
ncbi:Cytochrome P450 [Colletotrichum asianum]